MSAVVHRYGPPPGANRPPLVLLHAFPFDARMWDPVRDALPRVPVLVVDLPGFGAARAWAEPEGATLESFADAVAEALGHAGVHTAVVVGVSMGGYVAMALAERYPGLFAGIGLLDTKAAADPPEARANRLAVARRALEEGAVAVSGMADDVVGPTTTQHRPQVVQQVRQWLAQAPPEGIAAAQRALALRPDRLTVLQDLQVPALVLYGVEDAITGEEDHGAMGAALRTEPVRVPEAGHLAAVEQPEQVAAALAELVQRASR